MTTDLKTAKCFRCGMPFIAQNEVGQVCGLTFNWAEKACDGCRKASSQRLRAKKIK